MNISLRWIKGSVLVGLACLTYFASSRAENLPVRYSEPIALAGSGLTTVVTIPGPVIQADSETDHTLIVQKAIDDAPNGSQVFFSTRCLQRQRLEHC